MARAFRMSSERLRQLRRKMEEGGLAALTVPAKNGRPAKVTPKIRAKLEAMFESGLTIVQAHKKMRGLGKSTVGAVHTAWNAKKKAQQEQTSPDATQVTLPGIKRMAPPPPREPEAVVEEPVRGGAFVQHAGSWLMLGDAPRAGPVRGGDACVRGAGRAGGAARGVRCGRRRAHARAVVRRGRATRGDAVGSAAASCRTCPSPRTVRAIMRELSDELGAVKLHVGMLARYLADDGPTRIGRLLRRQPPASVHRQARRASRLAHAGQARSAWKHRLLRARRARPPAVSHRRAVARLAHPVAAADRQAAAPRDRSPRARAARVRPRRRIPRSDGPAARRAVRGRHLRAATVPAAARDRLHPDPSRRPGRRRAVHRVAHQPRRGTWTTCDASPSAKPTVARSTCSPSRSCPQSGSSRSCAGAGARRTASSTASSDGASTSSTGEAPSRTPPDTIVPNPARRRLDRDLRAAAIREGDARRLLAMLGDGDRRRGRVERDLAEAMTAQRDLEALRRSTPKRAPLRDTELAGKLVRHDGRVKMVLDSVRIACANVESELASELAPHLSKPREAKKTLANLFAAPGRIRVGLRTIAVDLAPAAKPIERIAFASIAQGGEPPQPHAARRPRAAPAAVPIPNRVRTPGRTLAHVPRSSQAERPLSSSLRLQTATPTIRRSYSFAQYNQ